MCDCMVPDQICWRTIVACLSTEPDGLICRSASELNNYDNDNTNDSKVSTNDMINGYFVQQHMHLALTLDAESGIRSTAPMPLLHLLTPPVEGFLTSS